VGTRWPTYFIDEIYNDLFEMLVVPYMDETIKITSFPMCLLKNWVELGVSDALIPPKSSRVSSCLFTNL